MEGFVKGKGFLHKLNNTLHILRVYTVGTSSRVRKVRVVGMSVRPHHVGQLQMRLLLVSKYSSRCQRPRAMLQLVLATKIDGLNCVLNVSV